MREVAVDHFITLLIENDLNHDIDRLHFQQGGAHSHYIAPVRDFLDNRFPGLWFGDGEAQIGLSGHLTYRLWIFALGSPTSYKIFAKGL